MPVQASDLWRGITACWDQKPALDQFRSALTERTGGTHCFLVSSGRAALSLILMGLKRFSGRKQVVVPAYTCPTVVQSVLKADLEPVLCDMSPRTLDLDRTALNRLMTQDVLAVVPAHLYGWAQDVRDLVSIGQERGFHVIEDAAQAFGATLAGRMVGTWGDAGFYSLGSGKCIPVGHGGVIVCQEWCAPAVSETLRDTLTTVDGRDLASLARFAGYGLATRPSGWWFIVRTPLNPTDAGMDAATLPPVKIRGMSATQAGIGLSLLSRLEQTQMLQRNNAQRLMDALAEFGFVTVPEIRPDGAPVFLRLPIIVDGQERANRLFDLLSREGIGASRSYWRTNADLFSDVLTSDDKDFPGALQLARCLLTLPTHAYLKEHDFQRIVATFRAVDRKN